MDRKYKTPQPQYGAIVPERWHECISTFDGVDLSFDKPDFNKEAMGYNSSQSDARTDINFRKLKNGDFTVSYSANKRELESIEKAGKFYLFGFGEDPLNGRDCFFSLESASIIMPNDNGKVVKATPERLWYKFIQ